VITSCEDWSHGKFEITNNTTMPIDSIFIVPDQASGKNYISLNPNQTMSYITKMGGVKSGDGAYKIQYKLASSNKSQRFGYFSNGASLEKLTKITIMPDTVLFKFIY
jgi:hypothetical protein